MEKHIEAYLKEKYNQWQRNKKELYGDRFPYDEDGVKGYTTKCAPTPWFGNINRVFKVVSLEPLLDDSNFNKQVEVSEAGYNQWRDFFFNETYFDKLYPNKLSRYWTKIAYYVKGYTNYEGNELKPVLKSFICEFPFIQYHLRSSQQTKVKVTYNVTLSMVEDLKRRILLGTAQQSQVIYFNGNGKWEEIKCHFEAFGRLQLLEDNLYNDSNCTSSLFQFTDDKGSKIFFVVAPHSSRCNLSYHNITEKGRFLREFLRKQNKSFNHTS